MAEFDLGKVLLTAEAIKGARRQSTTDRLREQYMGAQTQALQQNTQLQGQQNTRDQELMQHKRVFAGSNAVLGSDDPKGTLEALFPEIVSKMNPQQWASMTPEQIKKDATRYRDIAKMQIGGSESTSVQSTFQGQNGNAWVMTRDGQAVDTGVAMQKFSPTTIQAGGGLQVFDPNTRQQTGVLATPQQQIGAEAAKAGAVASARESAEIAAIPDKITTQAQAERAAAAPQRAEKVRQITSGVQNTVSAIDKAIDNSNAWTTGVPGKVTGHVPGSAAYDLGQTLLTVKANLGFDKLQAMREASPTGGALGAVAVQELAALQSTVASLDQDQSSQQLRANLRTIKTHYQNWVEAVEQANKDVAGKPGGALNVGQSTDVGGVKVTRKK